MIHCLFNMYLLIFSLESLRGFVHNLSPVLKRSKRPNWFEFHLQTSPSKVQRVVGFNIDDSEYMKIYIFELRKK